MIVGLLTTANSVTYANTLKVGVLAFNGSEKTIEKWQETIHYLSATINDYQFELVPVTNISELSLRTGKNEFDFILTNPSSYVEIEQKFDASRLLTLQNNRQNTPYTVFGSVIFTLKDRVDINHIHDLKNKSLMIVSRKGFGGWYVAWGEMLENEFDPYEELKELKVSNEGTQTHVVESVLNHSVDVGIVRTDMLERMDAANVIDISKIKVIGQKDTPGFPFLHSSKLYPEWAFAKAHNTSNEIAQKVAIALLQLHPNHIASLSGKYIGWNVPLNYEPVNDLLRQLRVDPYQSYGKLNLKQAFVVYKIEVLTTISLFIASLIMLFYFYRKNLDLNIKRNKILCEMKVLEKEVESRKNNITLLNTIGNAQSSYINTSNERLAFDSLLNGLLQLTGSHFGAIIDMGETNDCDQSPNRYQPYSVLARYYDEEGKLHTSTSPVKISNIQSVSEIIEQVARSKKPVISSINFTESGLFSQRVMKHMPTYNNIIAAPVLQGDKLLGIICLCNAKKEYQLALIQFLSPLFATCTNLITRFKDKKVSIHNEVALRESEKRQRKILSSISDALIIINESGKISDFNPAAERMFGYSNSEVMNKRVNMLMPAHLSEKHDYYIKKRIKGDKTIEGSIAAEIVGKRKDGSEFPALLSISEMLINDQRFFTGFIRDISDLKRNESLKREKEAAELANKTKSEFIANMSHELRTPMHGIMSFSKLGIIKIEKEDFKPLKKYFENIELSGTRLVKLINNILDLSSIETGHMRLDYEICDLNKIIDNCISETESLAENKSITIQTVNKDNPENPNQKFTLCCDQTRIHQVIINLLSNAIKFSPEKGKILITFHHITTIINEKEVDAIHLDVADEGLGIPADEVESIFEKFIQSSQTKTKAGGTGLGLSICREFIKLHHGEINASNRSTGGTEISVILPVEQIM